ncbi:MAG: transposase [Planctomycetota bacterium]
MATPPRMIPPTGTVMVTRRILKRQLRLHPSREVNQLILFLLAVAAERYSIKVHAFCVLSNHMHVIVSYSEKRLPKFMQFLDSQIARALNCHQGQWETVWAPGSYNKLDFLRDRSTILKYMLYVTTNPVAAGLVRRAKEWPGVKVLPHEIGRRVWKVDRPDFFFDADGKMPESVVLETSMPRIYGMSAEDARSRLMTEFKERERTIQRDRKTKKQGFLGARAVLAQSPLAYPKGGEPRRCRNPRLAASNRWARLEAIQNLEEFLVRHFDALQRFLAGDRKVVFPSGTYMMHVFFRARCEDPAPS